MEAFADYAMDASGTKEEAMLLRISKNAVDYDASAGAYAGDHLVGFTLIGIDTIDGLSTAYDAGTGIVPDFRGQGLAKQMFDHALPELQARGVQQFFLEVLQQNEPAIKAYQKSGFEIARELRCFVAETANLCKLSGNPAIEVRSTDAMAFELLIPEAAWTPSFENRFTAHEAIPDNVTFLGAYEGEECVGVISYCPDLNWLLSLLVRRSHRRRGVATRLLKQLALTIPDSQSKLAALNVDAKDQGMQDFLGVLGFDHLIDQYEMTRAL